MPRSLQTRLTLLLGLGVAIVWTSATVFTSLTITREMNQVFDSALQETAQRLLPLAEHELSDQTNNGNDLTLEGIVPAEETLTFIIRDETGHVRVKSRDARIEDFASVTALGFTNTDSQRIYVETNRFGTLSILIADPLSHRQDTTREAFIALISPLAFLLPVSMLGVWLIIRVSFRALRRFQSDIETRGGGDLSPISPEGIPTEMQPVLLEVNNLMDRLARAINTERSFTANSAHELRTPIAAALAQTQRLISELKRPQARDRALQIETALGRLASLSEKLLQLAKSEGAGLIAPQKSDLVPVLTLVVEDFLRLGHTENRIILHLPEGAVMASIDPNAFAILLRNLIENGLKHGDPAKPVEVFLSPQAELRVLSPGPEIRPELLKTLTRPFTRGETMASGTGLGLAIVKSIALGSGSTIALHTHMSNGAQGLEVVVGLA